MLSAINRQMISDGAIRVGELHMARPTELEGTLGIDGMWIDPQLLDNGRQEGTEYTSKNTVCSKLSMRRSAAATVAILSR